MHIINLKKVSIAAVFLVLFFIVTGFLELADARSRGGGRSFGRSKSPSVTKPAASRTSESATQAARPGNTGGAFSRGLAGGVAGGLMGGFLGNMLFGGKAHGMGTGGLGGSGIGLFEILLMAGLAYFLYKKFIKRQLSAATPDGGAAYAKSTFEPNAGFFGGQNKPEQNEADYETEDPLVVGVQQIWSVDETFHPDKFQETAQDLFFKIQAGWTRRDVSALKGLVGDQLLAEYERHFIQMAEKAQLNRLENIAVRNVDLMQAGVEDGEIFVTVRFMANLLDYTVDEKSGKIVGGDQENPVKFEESWTFARPVGTNHWKLEGIEVL